MSDNQDLYYKYKVQMGMSLEKFEELLDEYTFGVKEETTEKVSLDY